MDITQPRRAQQDAPNRVIYAKFPPPNRPGRIADYFVAIDTLPRGSRVVLASRKSRREAPEVLDRQAANLRRECADLVVTGTVQHTGSGMDPHWIIEAAALAKRTRAVAIVFESVSRACRNFWFHSVRRPDYQPTESDLRCLKLFTGNLKLVTLLPPTATPAEERAYQRRRGPSGRPPAKTPGWKKRRRERLAEKARALRAQNLSYRSVAAKLRVPLTTVREWCT